MLCDNIIESESMPIAPVTTTATLALFLAASKLVLWKARSYAKHLEERASTVWLDGSPQLDLFNINLHRYIIKTALDRGAESVRELTDNYDVSSTSLDANINYNTTQVGGFSSSKLPLLTLKPYYVLKPLRLQSLSPLCAGGLGSEDDKNDKTKAYRGVREVAFYESLQSAPSFKSSDYLLSGLELFMTDDTVTIYGLVGMFQLLSLFVTPNYMRTSAISFQNQYSFGVLCTLAAYQAGDHLTIAGVKSYATSWYNFLKEQQALKSLKKFSASYLGVTGVDQASQKISSMSSPYLILKDITSPFKCPNIIDIKMGTQTYEPDAPYSKQLREVQKYPLQSEIGFRIVGMRVYNPATDTYQSFDKKFGMKLICRTDCKNALQLFFQCNAYEESRNTRRVLSCVISKLTQIKRWLKTNDTLAFYASSILMAYEGSFHLQSNMASISEPMLKMIDFTHVCRKVGGDPGYIQGVDNLLSILSQVTHELES